MILSGVRGPVLHAKHGKFAAERSNNFDALRLCAAMLVIWGHQYALMGRPVPLIAGNEPGALGVVIFFAISGYLVTQSWLADPHWARFFARRILRIWPGLAMAVLLCVAIVGPVTTTLPLKAYLAAPDTWKYFSNLWLHVRFPLPGVFGGNPWPSAVNGPLWTIPLEVGCYGALAAAGVLGLARWRAMAPLAFLALALFLQWRYSPGPGQPMPPWSFGLQYAMVFALGAVLACWRFAWEPRRAVAMTVSLACAWALHAWGPSILSGQAPLLALACMAAMGGSAHAPVLARAGRFGDFSYGLYIYAFPVQQTVVWYFDNQLAFVPALLLSVAGALALAALSWHGVEKPALAFKPRRRP